MLKPRASCATSRCAAVKLLCGLKYILYISFCMYLHVYMCGLELPTVYKHNIPHLRLMTAYRVDVAAAAEVPSVEWRSQ